MRYARASVPRRLTGARHKISRLLCLPVHARYGSGPVFFFNLVLNINYAEIVNYVTTKERLPLNFYGR